MDRRGLLGSLLATIGLEIPSGQSKFYITGLDDDCDGPRISFGRNRVEALLNLPGVTVWSEDEWKKSKAGDASEEFLPSFEKVCSDPKLPHSNSRKKNLHYFGQEE